MHWDEECDLLIAGSGAGGMVGAYTAAREGLSVILLESTDRYGGTSAYSGGGMWLPGNAVLRRSGGDADLERARAYYHAVVGDRTPRPLQDTYIDTGHRLIDYLEEDEDFAFIEFPWPDYYGSEPDASPVGRHIVPASIPASRIGKLRDQLRPTLGEEQAGEPLADELESGQALIGRFLLALSKKPNASCRLNHRLVSLIEDGGRVAGAVVETPGGERHIRARKGVLIASGGFGHNAPMREKYGMPGAVAGCMSPPGNDGIAMEAAITLGADTDLMDQGWWSPGLVRADGRMTFTVGIDGGLFVNQRGERFMNETIPYDRGGRAIIDEMEAGRLTLPFWLIYDNRDDGAPPIQFPNLPLGNLDDYRAAGLLVRGDTLAELARKTGLPADALEASVARFNGLVEGGRDTDFHRGDEPYDNVSVGGHSPLDTVSRPPYFAIAFGLSDLGTKGGLRTDTHARVLDAKGAPIPGLYATGNAMAAVSGKTYPAGGNPVGSSMVFGYIAARDAAGIG